VLAKSTQSEISYSPLDLCLTAAEALRDCNSSRRQGTALPDWAVTLLETEPSHQNLGRSFYMSVFLLLSFFLLSNFGVTPEKTMEMSLDKTALNENETWSLYDSKRLFYFLT